MANDHTMTAECHVAALAPTCDMSGIDPLLPRRTRPTRADMIAFATRRPVLQVGGWAPHAADCSHPGDGPHPTDIRSGLV